MNILRLPHSARLVAALLFAMGTAEAGEPAPAVWWPEVWGNFGLKGYFDGERVAPNGVEFDPLFKVDFDLNVGLLPRKELYLFVQGEFWAQRAGAGITNDNLGDYDFSKREFDIDLGLAWTVVDHFELRASFDAFNNLNRGTTRTTPTGSQEGAEVEARYYFQSANIYDLGRLSFIGVGYYPTQNFIGGDGFEFRAGLFAQAYATYTIPALRSYLYGNVRLIGRRAEALELITVDAGLATRPFGRLQNLEFRVGDEFTADVEEDNTHNLIYAAIRAYFGPPGTESNRVADRLQGAVGPPEVWGDFGQTAYAAGDRMGPNGVAFNPIFMTDLDLNIGFLSRKRVYLFLESEFWVQRASAGVRGEPENRDLNQREYDIVAGLAWNVFNRFELRVSAYALNNLNRGGSQSKAVSETLPSGYQDGLQVEGRYNFRSENDYDVGRLSYIGLGYYTSQTLIGGDGEGFHPSFYAHAYGSYYIPSLRTYIYGDGQLIGEKQESLRLVVIDAGLAVRPLRRFENLEFRLGNEVTADLDAETTRDLFYGGVRINFSTR